MWPMLCQHETIWPSATVPSRPQGTHPLCPCAPLRLALHGTQTPPPGRRAPAAAYVCTTALGLINLKSDPPLSSQASISWQTSDSVLAEWMWKYAKASYGST